jgi:hypothetical protein
MVLTEGGNVGGGSQVAAWGLPEMLEPAPLAIRADGGHEVPARIRVTAPQEVQERRRGVRCRERQGQDCAPLISVVKRETIETDNVVSFSDMSTTLRRMVDRPAGALLRLPTLTRSR